MYENPLASDGCAGSTPARGTKKGHKLPQRKEFAPFFCRKIDINLHISKKSSNFARFFN
jgi:hypothetical protein